MSLKAIWSENTPYSKFLLIVGIVLISAIFFSMTGIVVAALIYGVEISALEKLLSEYTNPTTLALLKVGQISYTIGGFILPALLFAYFFDQDAKGYLGLRKKTNAGSVLLVLLALFSVLPFINFLGEINSHLALPSFMSGVEEWMKSSEEKAALMTEAFLDMQSASDMLFNIFMLALLPAIGEELLFRGILQRIFSEWLKNVHVAIWITAILFSAMHMQFYGFLPRMMLGVMLGYLYVWSGSLWLPMLAHLMHNAALVTLTYLFSEEVIGVDIEKIGTTSDYSAVLISAFFTAAFLWIVFKREKQAKEKLAI